MRVVISGYRYYSAEIGRWLSRDPIEEDGGINLYLSFNNDPLQFIDSEGFQAWKGCEKLSSKHLEKYQKFVENFNIATFPVVDCADTPIYLIMKFAEANQLELEFNGNGITASSKDKRFKKFNDYFWYMANRINSKNIQKFSFDVGMWSKGAGDFYYREPFTYVIPIIKKKVEITSGHILTLKSGHWWDIFAGSYDKGHAIKPEAYTWLGKENTPDAKWYQGSFGYMVLQRKWLHGPLRWYQFK